MAEAAGVILNEGQERALKAILDGRNVFLTGDAGTGKSVVVDRAKRELGEAGRKMLLCALAGVAAQNIGGVTIHRLFGLNPEARLYGKNARGEDILSVLSKEAPETFTATDVAGIIVDEVGMVRRDLMNAMVAIVLKANSIRRQNGLDDLQVVVVGDFMQLPPITKPEERKAVEAAFGCKGQKPESHFYAFESGGWAELGLEAHLLTEQVRQGGDEELRRNLDLARKGDSACIPFFNARVCESGRFPDDAVHLYGRNDRCDARNNNKLNELDGEEEPLDGEKEGVCPKDESLPAPIDLKLKKGARVMCTANGFDDRSGTGYCNGSLGYVRDFVYEEDGDMPSFIRVELDSGKSVFVNRWKFPYKGYQVQVDADGKRETVEVEVGSYRQFPLKLAYALTHYKGQGQTLGKAVVDPKAWKPGQLYTVLSRVRKIEDLYLTQPIVPKYLVVGREAVEFYKKLKTGEPAPVSASSIEDLRQVKEQIRRDELSRALKQKIGYIDEALLAMDQVSFRIRSSIDAIESVPIEKLGLPYADILDEAETALDELNASVLDLKEIREDGGFIQFDPGQADSDCSTGVDAKIENAMSIAKIKLDDLESLLKKVKTLEKAVERIKVKKGSTIVVRIDDKPEREFKIVDKSEGGPGRLTPDAPVYKDVIGRYQGETVYSQRGKGRGQVKIEIVKVDSSAV